MSRPRYTDEERKIKRREWSRNYRQKYPERAKASSKRWRENNPGYQRKYHKANSKHIAEIKRKYREKNREHLLKAKRQHYADNKENYKENMRKWKIKNPERRKELNRRWVKNNPDKCAAIATKRRARKLQATPKWANDKYIALFYKLAKIEEKRTGRKVHVDHIIPLKHPLVCGLHCEDNLQLLFADENRSKHNRFEIE